MSLCEPKGLARSVAAPECSTRQPDDVGQAVAPKDIVDQVALAVEGFAVAEALADGVLLQKPRVLARGV